MTKQLKQMSAWCIHLFTASGALCGLAALQYILLGRSKMAFFAMTLAVLIDAFDGFLARRVQVKRYAPSIDGALLDNMIDFFNYVLVPAFFLLNSQLLPEQMQIPIIAAMVLASCYQFSHINAKTADDFFLGFPSYWNIAVFYLYILQSSLLVNAVILSSLVLLVFIPIKYLYPSKPFGLSRGRLLPVAMYCATILWGISFLWLLFSIGQALPRPALWYSFFYVILYSSVSVYRTIVPLKAE